MKQSTLWWLSLSDLGLAKLCCDACNIDETLKNILKGSVVGMIMVVAFFAEHTFFLFLLF